MQKLMPEQSGALFSCAEERLVPCNCDAMSIAPLRIVVPQGEVLGASIVPEGNRIRTPLKPTLEFWILDMPEQHLKDRVALTLLQLHHTCCKQAAYK
jgi:hypothetical protein